MVSAIPCIAGSPGKERRAASASLTRRGTIRFTRPRRSGRVASGEKLVFSSVIFLFYFLPLFLAAYLCLAPWRAWVIVVGSFFFYAWGEPLYVPLLLAVILLNWSVGRMLGRAGPARRLVLAAGVAANLMFLVFFKYAGFLSAQFDALLRLAGVAWQPHVAVPLPLGVSFFTFQGISYLVDIHRGDVGAQPSLLKFAMYKSMFPQLIAGPIVRYRQIAAEIDNRAVSMARWRRGIEIFVLGLAQKVLIANTVALPADQIFALPPDRLTGATAWLGAVCYMAQIFFDFSGYTNMAIGLGHMMGFTLPRNFDRPYQSQSVTEFWRRWHMTLSSWFRDYLYIPLGGNRHGAARTYGNLLAVFFLCGLWHGASWTFAIWGLYHGAFLIAERATRAVTALRVWRPVRHAYLLLVVLVGWVLFRADSMTQFGTMLRAMLGFGGAGALAMPPERYATGSVAAALLAAALLSAAPPLAAWRAALTRLGGFGASGPGGSVPAVAFDGMRIAGVLSLFLLAATVLSAGTYNPFIYFRF